MEQIQDPAAEPGPRPGKKKHRPSVAVGLWIIKRIERLLVHYSLVDNTPFLEPAQFPWAGMLERETHRIRAELDAVMRRPEGMPNFQEISRDQENITRDDRWKSFFLYGYGYRFDRNCTLCPETTRIIESIPGMFTAFFSVLAPGKHIPRHRGPYKGVLRCHLGLIVPEPRERCRIQVGDEQRHWETGHCMVFDDTYKHEVWNDTDGTRVVLFLDIIRPLRFPGSLINRIVLGLIRRSPFIQDARRNQRAWEKALGC